ncbi:hypothetical protein SAMN05660226_01996 [Parapedobacter luteus]|uniref:Uncharacterized protein n=1 Tax=Parapedobacter luteus TaxID=623280 RepID=A0A1T5CA50_9SPHI|nr:hypothetical protein [Parapedobacter luteus]SKB56324.1 hypothetical protein SAMN05660226_01996 [Parapedobacter luteus]
MNPQILTPDVQQYLRTHEAMPPTEMALRKSPFPHVSSLELAQQLDGRQRSRKKLPLWYDIPGIYYPEKRAMEQASSQTTAQYKASLIRQQSRIIDLTGGLGVDTYFFAQRAETVIHCEKNEALSRIAAHNALTLGIRTISFIADDGLAYLRSQGDNAFDYAYIDPSRRVESRKVFRLEDCEPNVVEVQQDLLQKAGKLLIKAAPLLDISAALQALNKVSEVHIISVDNECKELLFVLDSAYAGTPQLVAAVLKNNVTRTFSFEMSEETAAVSHLGLPEHYLYEPDAALLKSGAFKLIGQRYGLKKLHQHTHLYTSTTHHPDFMGKTFRVDRVTPYTDFKNDKSIRHAAVSTRNFPLKVEALRKRHRIHDGADMHLFFCTGPDDVLLVIFASKC